MNVQERIELSCSIAGYIVEKTCPQYPYEIDENGEVKYKDFAQEIFNGHYDIVRELVDAVEGETE